MLGTNGMLPAKKNAAAIIARCKRVCFHKNLPGAIANAASQIRPRVYYDRVTFR